MLGQAMSMFKHQALERSEPLRISAEARVTDVNRQAWSGKTSWLVHPAKYYVGTRAKTTFVPQGEPLKLDVIVVDAEGNKVAGRRVKVEATLVTQENRKGQWKDKETPNGGCTLESGDAPKTCVLQPKGGGRLQVIAQTTDDNGRVNTNTRTFWIPGGQVQASKSLRIREVTLIPAKQRYRPGEVAKILVTSPFWPAEGLATVRRNGIAKTIPFKMTKAHHTLEVPIDQTLLPDFTLHVITVGRAKRSPNGQKQSARYEYKPAQAEGSVRIKVELVDRTLAMEVRSAEAVVMPGAKSQIHVTVKDSNGQPVAGAETAIFAVDESILNLAGYTFQSPLTSFIYKQDQRSPTSACGADYRSQQPQLNSGVAQMVLRGEPVEERVENSAQRPVRRGLHHRLKWTWRWPLPNQPGWRWRWRMAPRLRVRPFAYARTLTPSRSSSAPRQLTKMDWPVVPISMPDTLTDNVFIALAAVGEGPIRTCRVNDEGTVTHRP